MERKRKTDQAFADAIIAVGSQVAYAKLVGRSQAAVSERLNGGKPMWAEDVLAVETATGISRHALRPDLYPMEDAPAPARDGGQA